MKKTNYLKIIIFLVAILSLCIWIIFKTSSDENNLIKNKIATNGTITNVYIFPRGEGIWVEYEFEVTHKIYQNKTRLFIESKYLDFLKSILNNKTLPIIYDSKDIENNKMLFSKKEYEIYKEQRNDSLVNLYLKIDSLEIK